MMAVLGEGDADRVADSVGKQRPDADRALDPAILAITRLGDPEMDWVVPVRALRFQTRHQQPVRDDHDLGVGGLHREDHPVKIEVPGNPGKLQRALHHPERRVSEAVHDPVAQGAVVGTDPQRDTALLAEIDQRREALPDPVEFRRIFGIAVVADIELLGVCEVSGVDPHLLDPLRRLQRRLRFEMDVGDQWNMASRGIECGADVLETRGILHRRRGDPHHLASGLDQTKHLADTGFSLHGVAGDHRLDADRVRPSESQRTDHHLPRRTTTVGIEIRRIRKWRSRCLSGATRLAHGLAGAAEVAGEKVIVSAPRSG